MQQKPGEKVWCQRAVLRRSLATVALCEAWRDAHTPHFLASHIRIRSFNPSSAASYKWDLQAGPTQRPGGHFPQRARAPPPTRVLRVTSRAHTMSSRLSAVEPSRKAAGDKPSCSAIYRNSQASPDGPPRLDAAPTIHQAFQLGVQGHPQRPCMGHRPSPTAPFEFMTYTEVSDRVDQCSSALARLCDRKATVGIFGANSAEWMISLLACARVGLIAVPLYESLGRGAVEFMLAHAEVRVVMTAGEKLARLAEAVGRAGGAAVRSVVHWGGGGAEGLEGAVGSLRAAGAEVVTFEDFIAQGKQELQPARLPSAEDLAVIMYTSGSTGEPKGVMLTHAHFTNNTAALKIAFPHIGPSDSFLSFLPLAHIFGLTFEISFLSIGAAIGYWQGSPTLLLNDAQALKPTFFIGVPRIFDRLVAAVKANISQAPPVKRCLFTWGYKLKLALIRGGTNFVKDLFLGLINRVLFKSVHNLLGGRMKIVASGGAALSAASEEFLRVCFCCPVHQGYGLTETTAAIFVAKPREFDMMGTVGPPLVSTTFRLESVPDLGYSALAVPPYGEVLVKSSHNFLGYYKDPAKTKEAIDEEGWFHTGDIGTIVNGCLKIIDRKKNIFKLSQGEYVVVESVEAVYKKCQLVDQIWVYGDSSRAELLAIVIPQKDALEAWGGKTGLQGEFVELCKSQAARAFVLEQLQAVGQAEGLRGFEIVKRVFLDSKAFSVDNGLLTPTFKPRRNEIKKKYIAQVDAMYASLS